MVLNRVNLKSIVLSAMAAGAVLGATSAHAQVTFGALPNGTQQTYSVLGLTTVGGLPAGFTQFGSTQTAAYSATNAGSTISGNLLSAVFSNVGDTELIFAYQIQTGAGNASVGSFSVAGFGGRTLTFAATTDTDVDGAGGLSGSTFGGVDNDLRSSTGSDNGNSVAFSSLSAITSGGQNSATFFLRMAGSTGSIVTNGGAAVLGGGVSANTSANIITSTPLISTAPEPGTLVLAGLGIAGLALRRRRK